MIRDLIIKTPYNPGERLPPEREIAEMLDVTRTVVREALIMLEIKGLVEVRRGAGIYVLDSSGSHNTDSPDANVCNDAGPFELLQARQLLESNIAEFAATQVTKQDIMALLAIQETAQKEDRARDSQWDKEFHIQVAKATQNSVLVTLVEKVWQQREQNPYWRKLHEHIDDKAMESWCEDHEQILKALMRKDPKAAKLAMWQHLENTKQMLFQATTTDDDLVDDRYLFAENPVVHLARA